jgi:hypothetical protein
MIEAMTVSTMIGKGLLTSALGDLYTFIKCSAYQDHFDQLLIELDLKSELDVVQALLQDLADHRECRAVKVASDQLRESVECILQHLKEIQDELEFHKTRYFNSWRTPNCGSSIQKLQFQRDLFRKRRELLLSVLKVQPELQSPRRLFNRLL